MIYLTGDTHGDFDRYLNFTSKIHPNEVFLSMIDQSTVDNTTGQWLNTIEEKIEYSKWYCGHYHTTKKIDKVQFMFEDIDMLMAP